MSEYSRKRSRKTKLVPRMYVNLEEENLQSQQKQERKSSNVKGISCSDTLIEIDKCSAPISISVKVEDGDDDDWWKSLENEATSLKLSSNDDSHLDNEETKGSTSRNKVDERLNNVHEKHNNVQDEHNNVHNEHKNSECKKDEDKVVECPEIQTNIAGKFKRSCKSKATIDIDLITAPGKKKCKSSAKRKQYVNKKLGSCKNGSNSAKKKQRQYVNKKLVKSCNNESKDNEERLITYSKKWKIVKEKVKDVEPIQTEQATSEKVNINHELTLSDALIKWEDVYRRMGSKKVFAVKCKCDDCKLCCPYNIFKKHISTYHATKPVNITTNFTGRFLEIVAKIVDVNDKPIVTNCSFETLIEKAFYSVLALHMENDQLMIWNYKCYFCRQSWLNYYTFQQHLLLFHPNCTVFPIEVIEDNFASVAVADSLMYQISELPIYSDANGDNRIYASTKCTVVFSTEECLKDHLKYYQIVCTECKSKDRSVVKTQRSSCQKSKTVFPKACRKCDVILWNPKQLEGHKTSCDKTPSAPQFQCLICNHPTSSFEQLTKHRTLAHDVRSDEFVLVPLNKTQCEDCSSIYIGPESLHFCPRRKDSVECEYCSGQFQSDLFLAVHHKAYSGSVTCEYCFETLERECMLPEHKSICQDFYYSTGYRCNICFAMFLTTHAIEEHISKMHPAEESAQYKFTFKKVVFSNELHSLHINEEIMTTYKDDSDVIREPGIPIYMDSITQATSTKCKRSSVLKKNLEYCFQSKCSDDEENLKRKKKVRHKPKKDVMKCDKIYFFQSKCLDDEQNIKQEKDHKMGDDEIKYDEIKTEKRDETYDSTQASCSYSTDIDQSAKSQLDSKFVIKKEKVEEECIDSEHSNTFQNEKNSVFDNDFKYSNHITDSVDQTKDIIIKKETEDPDYAIEEEDDIIIFQELSYDNENNDYRKSINEAIDTSTEPDNDSMIDLARKKEYACTKCGFYGIHKLYKKHLPECEKRYPRRRKKRFADKYANIHLKDISLFKCSLCNTEFHSIYYYAKHLPGTHDLQRNLCPCCRTTFTTTSSMLLHFKKSIKALYVRVCILNKNQKTDAIKLYHCTKCKQAVEPKEFFNHWETHLEITSLKDEVIDTSDDGMVIDEDNTTGTEDEIDSKLIQVIIKIILSRSQKKENLGNRKCMVCMRQFMRNIDFKRHLIEHLNVYAVALANKQENFGQLKCQICSNAFPDTYNYKRHMREHAAMSLYQCHLCNKVFSDSSNFAKHKKVHNYKVLICDLCNKKFHSWNQLEKHILLHKETKPIRCEICNKLFHFESSYRKHCRNHNKLLHVFTCRICGEKFSSRKENWEHDWKVHRISKRQAECPTCGEKFRKPSDVKAHIRQVHTKPKQELDVSKIFDTINKYNVSVDVLEEMLKKRAQEMAAKNISKNN